ncbi:hypothetical protein Tco_0358839 [Tanacetum coccineum]
MELELTLLGINLQLLVKVNAARHKLTTAIEITSLVDGKKIIITESTVRRDLQLEDAEGVDCLPNSTIFEQLTLMSSKTTAWNEFSSTMASAIICLATNQKFNFSKYIFESMVKNLDNVGKFLMYPRFIQVFLDKQLEGMPTHNRIYIAPSHTKKIFGNMRRVGKGFSGRETPLFQTMVVQDQAEMGEGSANLTDPHHTPTFIQPSTSQPQKKQKPGKPNRKNTQIPQSSGPTKQVADEAIYKELDDSLVRVATTASSLEEEQESGNIAKTQSKATPNESSSLGTTSGGDPRRQETMGDTIAQTRFENVSKHSNDPLLARARVESSRDEESLGEDASKQGRINAIDVDEDITLVNDQDDADMFDVNTLTGDEVLAEQEVATKDVNLTVDEVSVATTTKTATIPTLRKGIVITELGTSITTTIISSQPSQAKVQDKGKEKIIEPKKPLKKKDQISFDEQEAIRLHVEFDEEERLTREKDEANVALTEEWDDIHAKVDADYQLAQRLHAEEQEQFTTKQKATLFKELQSKEEITLQLKEQKRRGTNNQTKFNRRRP